MAKGPSTTKGKATHVKAPRKKPGTKKAEPKKTATTKKKGPQKRAATELSSDEDSEEESDHRARKRKHTKKDTSDSEVVEVNDPAEGNETVGNEQDSEESEVKILQLFC